MSDDRIPTPEQEAERAADRTVDADEEAPKLTPEQAQAVLLALDPFWTRGIVPDEEGEPDADANTN